MSALTEKYSGRKLKIWSKQRPGQVFVIQDGTLPDSDATIQVDDGFADGYASFGASDRPDRIGVALDWLECNREGKRFAFRVLDYAHSNELAIGFGDRVEFSVDQGANLPAGGTFPSWHSNASGSSVRVQHFHGFVQDFKRVRQEGGVTEFAVECVDGMAWANEITVVRDLANGVYVPTLIIGNVDPKKDPQDHFLGIKKLDATPTFGWGNSRNPALKITTGEILAFLEAQYGATLLARDIIATDLFVQAELDLLTAEPPKMVFENEGFGDVVRRVIRTSYPDHDIRVDPRTRKWHIVKTNLDLLHQGFTTVTAQPASDQVTVSNVAAFATSGDGSSVRLVKATDPYKTEVFQILSIATNTLTLDRDTAISYASGDLALPMADIDDRVPTVGIELEEYSTNNSLSVDLSRSFTAVRVVGTRSKSERVKINQTAGGPRGVKLVSNWDSNFNNSYAYDQHSWRVADRGADGDGIVIDEIGSIGGKTRIYFTMTTSAYGDDHLITDGAGNGEWKGGVVVFITHGGANIESGKTQSVVEGIYQGWKDSPSNTIRRYELRLDRDLSTELASLLSEVADGAGNGDRFELTHSDIYDVVNPNGRWTQGRVFHLENTTGTDEAQYLSDLNCPARSATPIIDHVAWQRAQSVYRSSDAPRTWDELNAHWNLNPSTNPLGGQARAWFLPSRPQPAPATQPEICIPQVAPPPPVEIEMDRFTFDAFQVRVPTSGFAGAAYWLHAHEKELIVSFDTYEHASQDDQFAAIAESLWHRLSDVQYTGEIELIGVVKWLPLADLSFRCTFGNGGTGGPAGVQTDQSRFYGLAQTIRYDFPSNSTSLSFDSRGFADDLVENLFDRKFVSETAEMRAIREELERVKRETECERMNPRIDPPPVTPSCTVFAPGGESLTKTKTKVEVKQDGLGTGDTMIGAPSASSAGAASGSYSGSLGYRPTWVIERDWLGQVGAFLMPHGAYCGGTLNGAGNHFIPSSGTPLTWTPLPVWNSQGAQELDLALWGIDAETPGAGTRVQIASGSTTTVLQLASAIHNDGRYVGGTVEFFAQGFEARPAYAIASHTGTTITLSSAMTESIPTAGMVAKLWPARLPTLDATDFPNGGKPFKDAAGNWFVATAGALIAATESGGVLTEDDTDPATPALSAGNSSAAVTPVGAWDLSGENVTGVAKNLVWSQTLRPGDFHMLDTGAGYGDAGLAATATSSPRNLPALTFSDGVVTKASWFEFVPDDLDTAEPVSLKIYFYVVHTVTPPVAVEIEWSISSQYDNEAVASAGFSTSGSKVVSLDTYTAGDLLMVDIGVIVPGGSLSRDELFHGEIKRDAQGSNADDTYSGAIQLIGGKLTGKRSVDAALQVVPMTSLSRAYEWTRQFTGQVMMGAGWWDADSDPTDNSGGGMGRYRTNQHGALIEVETDLGTREVGVRPDDLPYDTVGSDSDPLQTFQPYWAFRTREVDAAGAFLGSWSTWSYMREVGDSDYSAGYRVASGLNPLKRYRVQMVSVSGRAVVVGGTNLEYYTRWYEPGQTGMDNGSGPVTPLFGGFVQVSAITHNVGGGLRSFTDNRTKLNLLVLHDSNGDGTVEPNGADATVVTATDTANTFDLRGVLVQWPWVLKAAYEASDSLTRICVNNPAFGGRWYHRTHSSIRAALNDYAGPRDLADRVGLYTNTRPFHSGYTPHLIVFGYTVNDQSYAYADPTYAVNESRDEADEIVAESRTLWPNVRWLIVPYPRQDAEAGTNPTTGVAVHVHSGLLAVKSALHSSDAWIDTVNVDSVGNSIGRPIHLTAVENAAVAALAQTKFDGFAFTQQFATSGRAILTTAIA